MRRAVTIDRRQVRIPHLAGRTYGYGKGNAQVGDLLTYREYDNGPIEHGRMIGRATDAPDLDHPGRRLPALIVVLQLGEGLSHAYERWIRPERVIRIVSSTGLADWLAFFMGPDCPMGEDARYLAEYGSLSADHEGMRDHVAHCRGVLMRKRHQERGTYVSR
jgi:hypothetical protein